MGFVNGVNSFFAASSSLSTPPFTVSLPTTLQDGDLVLVVVTTGAGGATPWTVGASGFTNSWTSLFQKNGSSSFGGRAGLFSVVWKKGDNTSAVFSGPAGGVCAAIAVNLRSAAAAGGSLVVGNPPASGFSGTYDVEVTTAQTTITIPAIAVAHPNNYRLVFQVCSTSVNCSPPAEASTDLNHAALTYALFATAQPNSSLCLTGHYLPGCFTVSEDSGSTVWTGGTNVKRYAFGFSVDDGGAVGLIGANKEEFDVAQVNISAVADEHFTTAPSGGGAGGGGSGAGISVY